MSDPAATPPGDHKTSTRESRFLKKLAKAEVLAMPIFTAGSDVPVIKGEGNFFLYCPKCERLVVEGFAPDQYYLSGIALKCFCEQHCVMRALQVGPHKMEGAPQPTEQLDPRWKFWHHLNWYASLNELSAPSALHVLVYTRELIEYLDLQEKYAIANMFCHWSVHTQLRQTTAGYNMLRNINAIADLSTAAGESEGVHRAIHEALSFSKLRSELRSLYAHESLPAPFLDSWGQWNQFLAQAMVEYRGKPIQFPAGDRTTWTGDRKASARRVYDECVAAKLQGGAERNSVIVSIRFEIPHVSSQGGSGQVHWICATEGGVEFKGKLNAFYHEPREVFRND